MPDAFASLVADGIPTGRLRRLARPAALGARGAVGAAGTWARGLLRSPDARQEAQVARAIRTAEQAVAVMGEMKGAVMKLGQMMSFADTSMLPDELQAVMAQLQSDAPPMAWELVEQVVTAELGASPEQAFERFAPVPMAAASIGQVHSARLHDGRDVVVKVQYPGVADAIDADLRNTSLISTAVGLASSLAGPFALHADIKAMAAELRDRLAEELDYRLEAQHQQRFAELWAGDPAIKVPAVIPDLSTGRVLTQEYHDGMRWSAAVEADQDLRNKWGEAIYRFVFTSLYRHHVFNADPHPGNYLFHEDGSVSFLDFGCVKSFTDEDVEGLRGMSWSIIDGDADRLRAAMLAMGWYAKEPRTPPEEVLDMFAPGWAPVAEAQPFSFTPEWAAKAVQFQMGVAPGRQRAVAELTPPPQYLFLARISIGLFSVLTGLRASGNWLHVFEEIEGGRR